MAESPLVFGFVLASTNVANVLPNSIYLDMICQLQSKQKLLRYSFMSFRINFLKAYGFKLQLLGKVLKSFRITVTVAAARLNKEDFDRLTRVCYK
eukprot:5337589-Amphidinium_carterae.1